MANNVDSSARGGSLVGTLMVLVILGGLSAVVVTSLPSGDSGILLRGGSDTSAPGTSPSGSPPGGRSSAPGKPVSLSAAAAAAACSADERSIEVAVATEHASDGKFPSTIGGLVAGKWLSSAPAIPGYQLSLESVGGVPTGRVLVNGQPGTAGCDAGPRGGQ